MVQNKTLVWNPGLPFDWVEFGSVSPEYFSSPTGLELSEKSSEETVTDKEKQGDLMPCDECGRLFASSELLNRENYLLCKECSPHFNQQYLNQLKDMKIPRCAECGKESWSKELFPCGNLLVCADCKPLFIWYYKDQEKSIGPFKEEKFRDLAALGVIRPETMVWNPRMHYGWVTYKSLTPHDFTQRASIRLYDQAAEKKPAENEGRCIECGKIFSRAEMIPYNQFFVCANCKPIFLQKLKEGAYKEEPVDVTEEMRYAGFWIRLLAKLSDGIIFYVLNLPISLITKIYQEPLLGKKIFYTFLIQGNLTVIGFVIHAAYDTFFVGKWGATPGKMIFNLRIVTANKKRVSYLRALGRHFAQIISWVICGIGYFMVAFDNEKRGLHDHICYTRVIHK